MHVLEDFCGPDFLTTHQSHEHAAQEEDVKVALPHDHKLALLPGADRTTLLPNFDPVNNCSYQNLRFLEKKLSS
ncbi:hypothetical protein SLEP1_g19676 [Rubroshorea leprosula]|uniref:Uncharacterized protein n=1 Tax=Rubroshorea leprosula TaxID=152421 RepID=A0AAV5J923_9ROSI|nr:hypothetical protein SLEP1_g19676 [Rubroshorea leprosula]